MRARSLSILGAVLALATPRVASGDRTSEAEAAFRDGRKLIESGHVHEACKKFEQSQALEPSAGTQLNLAGCYEREQRNALAYATYNAAAAAAAARKRADWEKTARSRADALESKLPKLVVEVPEATRVADLAVTRDGERVDPSAWGLPVPVDPGVHVIEASAPGRRPARVEVRVAELTTTAVIAPLEKDKDVTTEPPRPASVAPRASAPAAPPSNADTGGHGSRRSVGLVVGGAGIAALAFAGIGVLVGKNALDDAKTQCPTYPNDCSPSAARTNDRALGWLNASTVAVVAGALLVATGVVLYLTAPRARSTSLRFDPLGARW